MSPEDSPIGMEFINHHKFQILEKVHPLRVVGKDSCMEHVRVGDHNIPAGPDGLTGILRSISIIGERSDRFFDSLDEILEFNHLVLGESLGGKEVKGL
jgi:hypothetical protein